MKINHKKLSILAPLLLMGIAGVSAAIVASYQVTSSITITSTPSLFLVKLSNGLGYTSENYTSTAPPANPLGAGFCFRNVGNTILWVGGSQAFVIASGALPGTSTLSIVADGDSTFTSIAPLSVAIGATACGAANGYHLRLVIPTGTAAGTFNWVVKVQAFDVSTP